LTTALTGRSIIAAGQRVIMIEPRSSGAFVEGRARETWLAHVPGGRQHVDPRDHPFRIDVGLPRRHAERVAGFVRR